jgi:hypothetical protein
MTNLEIRHRSVLIYDEKNSRRRTVLACVAGGSHAGGCFRWRCFSTCTYYSRLHWRWFEYVSPSYCTASPSLVLARFRFLLDHVLAPCCSTCQFSIGIRVVLRMGHVSLLHWTMCLIFIGQRGRFLFNHVSRCCPSTFCFETYGDPRSSSTTQLQHVLPEI